MFRPAIRTEKLRPSRAYGPTFIQRYEEGGVVEAVPAEAIESQPAILVASPMPMEEPEELADNDEVVEEAKKGFFDKIADFVLGELPKSFTNFLRDHGDKPISDLTLRRMPILKAVNFLMDAMSAGKFSKLKEKAGYDNFFHLQLLFTIDGKRYIIEKNQTWKISDYDGVKPKEETLSIRSPSDLTLNQLFNRAYDKYGKNRINTYNALSTNCQRGLLDLLSASSILTKRAKSFILQPIDELAKELPEFAKRTSQKTTKFASIFDRFIQKISNGMLRLEEGGLVDA